MALDELLLQCMRAGSRDLWRGVRTRLGTWLILLTLLFLMGFIGGLGLLGGSLRGPLQWNAGLFAGVILLLVAALCGGLGLAWVDSAHALIVAGPHLRSLGDVLLEFPIRTGLPRPEDQFTTFASPERLARTMRIRDLPLLLFLGQVVFRLNITPLLGAAHAGLRRETLVREMERLGRQRAAVIVSRLRAFVWLFLGAALLSSLLIVWLSR